MVIWLFFFKKHVDLLKSQVDFLNLQLGLAKEMAAPNLAQQNKSLTELMERSVKQIQDLQRKNEQIANVVPDRFRKGRLYGLTIGLVEGSLSIKAILEKMAQAHGEGFYGIFNSRAIVIAELQKETSALLALALEAADGKEPQLRVVHPQPDSIILERLDQQ